MHKDIINMGWVACGVRPSGQRRAQGVKGTADTGQQGLLEGGAISAETEGEQASAESLGFYRMARKQEGTVERGEHKEGE